MTPEVAVIGAGPAGILSAIAFARSGVSTLLCDASRLPIDKACGEGLMPNALRDLEQLGVPACTLEGEGHPFAGVRYISPAGRVATAQFDGSPGLGLRRTALSRALAERVLSLPNLRCITGQTASVRVGLDGAPTVALGDRELRPRLVVGADGLNSRCRRAMKISARLLEPRRWGTRVHFDVSPWTDHVEVHWSETMEAYVTPVSRSEINVALLWSPDEERKRFSRGPAFARDWIDAFPALRGRLRGVPTSTSRRSAGPMHQRPSTLVRDGFLLAGDAAGYVDAITGEGVGLAAAQALLIERLVVPALRSARAADASVVPREALLAYARAARSLMARHERLTRLLLWVRAWPELLERSIGALASDPALFRHFLSANRGSVSAFRVPPRSAARFFIHLVSATGARDVETTKRSTRAAVSAGRSRVGS